MISSHLLLFSSLFFLASHTCFSTRMSPGFVPHHPNPWQHFNNLLNSKRGSHAQGISHLKKYLHRFGYFPMENPNGTTTNRFDTRLEHALARYQAWHGLPVTRVIDPPTLSAITSPRCGAPDTTTTTSLHVTQHYVYFDGQPRWVRKTPMTLSYSFSREKVMTYLSMQDVRKAFERAFKKWESIIPISFEESDAYTEADVKIGFYGGEHGDGEAFDGPLGVLGHAFSPDNGRLHLDIAEKWAVDFGVEKSKVAVDLESVALHEIGHVLGLAHSMDKDAVMYPSLKPRAKKLHLSLDDVKGVQALYGSNPNFTIGSLLQSETSATSLSYSTYTIICIFVHLLLLIIYTL